MEDDQERAFRLAAHALASRDHARAAIEDRLVRAGVDADQAEVVVGRLVGAGYVDDARLARDRAASLVHKGYGNAAIAAKLSAEGVCRSAVEDAIGSLAPEEERAREVASRRGLGADRIEVYLSRRGFGLDAIEAARAALDAQDPPSLRYEL